MLELFDSTVVSWSAWAKKLQMQRLMPMVARSTLDGAFWGMLFGSIYAPFLVLAPGTAMGAILRKTCDNGINENFIKSMHEKITQGTSANFVLKGDSTTDKVGDPLKQLTKFELIRLHMSNEQEEVLRIAFI